MGKDELQTKLTDMFERNSILINENEDLKKKIKDMKSHFNPHGLCSFSEEVRNEIVTEYMIKIFGEDFFD